MRILYFSPHPYLRLGDASGSGTHMRELIGAFRAAGHDVREVIIGDRIEWTSTSTTREAIRLRDRFRNVIPDWLWETGRDGRRLIFDARAREILSSEVQDHLPDLIYERGSYMSTAGGAVAVTLGVTNVLEVNEPFSDERGATKGLSLGIPLGRRRETERVRQADLVVAVSGPLKDHLCEKHGIPCPRVVSLPNAVPKSWLSTSQGRPPQETGPASPKPLTVGFVGSIADWHDVGTLLEAFAAARREHPTMRLEIVGGGESLPSLRDLADRLNIADRTTFTGRVSHAEAEERMRRMDVAVVPGTNWYMSPIKLFEYGAAGAAVIAPDMRAVAEVVEHERHGILVPPGAVPLAEAILRYARDEGLRNRVAAAFHAKIRAEHTWERNACRILAALGRPERRVEGTPSST